MCNKFTQRSNVMHLWCTSQKLALHITSHNLWSINHIIGEETDEFYVHTEQFKSNNDSANYEQTFLFMANDNDMCADCEWMLCSFSSSLMANE